MSIALFELEEERLKDKLLRKRAKRILIQLPEGFKNKGPRLAFIAEETGAMAIISADPCYGACDLSLNAAKSLGVDLIIHYGHTEMLESVKKGVPVIYIDARANIEIGAVVKKAVDKLQPWKSIGLATTVQHVHVLKKAKKILTEAGKTVYIGSEGSNKYPGQVLGCNYSNAKSISYMVEAFLFIGGGRFHALGLFLATMKPIVIADPFEDRAYSIDTEAQRMIRKRLASIDGAKRAQNFGVIIGLKPGQCEIENAVKVKKALTRKGKKAVLLALHEVTSFALQKFPTLDAFINTACPRIALDDLISFTKPILNLNELNVVLGKISWENLLESGFV
jgi:2-(3-amino-3-carboxypropyl)histidine synthase